MIIQVLCNLFEEGYQRWERDSSISPFFAGANVAFRRQALDQIGTYDENCASGEDQDMWLRIIEARWEAYFEPKAAVRHKNRLTVRSLIRQWFRYGYHHPYVTRKHGSRGVRVYRRSRTKGKGAIYDCLLTARFPFDATVFLTTFLSMHAFFALAVLFAALAFEIPAIVTGVLALVLVVRYFRSDVDMRDPLQTVSFVFLRYIANLALLLGGLLGGIRLGMLYVSPTFDYKA